LGKAHCSRMEHACFDVISLVSKVRSLIPDNIGANSYVSHVKGICNGAYTVFKRHPDLIALTMQLDHPAWMYTNRILQC